MRTLIVTQHVRASAQAIPLAAGCIKAVLPAAVQEQTEIIDIFPGVPVETLCRQLLARQPAVIAFSLALWNRRTLLQLARLLRRQRPDLYLLAGGPETAGDCRQIIEEGWLDGVIRGEGELAFAALLQALSSGRPVANIPGFIGAGQPSADSAPALCPDLARLPSPWLTGQLPLTADCGVLWEVARGCPFNCAFCYDAKGQQGVRTLPFERLRQELELFSAAGVGQIWILDSTFNAPPERGRKLLELLLDSAPQIHYHIEAKSDFLDRQTIALLSQLSCSVQIGLQSARPEILKTLHRHFNPQQTRQALKRLNQAGIVFGLDLIYGLPGDNHGGFAESLDFALDQQPNQIDIFPLSILPGTELHQRQEEFAIRGQSAPPYLIEQSRGYPPEQMDQSRLLAAATDIFYNRGRAVGFFLQFCSALKMTPVLLLQAFLDWLIHDRRLSQRRILAVEDWTPAAILPLQLAFIRARLRRHKRTELIPVAEDLLHFHYLCAESLLAQPCRENPEPGIERLFAKRQWQLNPAVGIGRFHYDPAELEAAGAQPLEWICRHLEEAPGYALFLNRNDNLTIDSLDEPFARMLLAATTAQSGQALLQQLEPDSASALVAVAVEQGLLLPVT